MMEATNFDRDGCQIGYTRKTYDKLQREYRCNACGGRLVMQFDGTRGWHVECGRCGSVDFIHERELQRQKSEALEVKAGLSDELLSILK